MNTKILTSVGCLLLLAAAMTPAVLGHDERATSPGTANGVSGRYVGAAGQSTTDRSLNNPAVIEGADVTSAGGLMNCDLEVAGPGLVKIPLDESLVDGASGGTQTNTWDDGGEGGACHTTGYDVADYNTDGCPDAIARAEDSLAGNTESGVANGDVWIGASCDWEATDDGSDLGPVTCIANGIDIPPNDALECILRLVNCLISPLTCPTMGTDSCGNDGTSDGTNFGWGGDGVAYPRVSAQFGEAFKLGGGSTDTDGDNCPDSDASASVFVFANVDVDNGTSPPTVTAYPVGSGEIWTV
jgi:hypothetical protein